MKFSCVTGDGSFLRISFNKIHQKIMIKVSTDVESNSVILNDTQIKQLIEELQQTQTEQFN